MGVGCKDSFCWIQYFQLCNEILFRSLHALSIRYNLIIIKLKLEILKIGIWSRSIVSEIVCWKLNKPFHSIQNRDEDEICKYRQKKSKNKLNSIVLWPPFPYCSGLQTWPWPLLRRFYCCITVFSVTQVYCVYVCSYNLTVFVSLVNFSSYKSIRTQISFLSFCHHLTLTHSC